MEILKARLKRAYKSWTVWFNSLAVMLIAFQPQIETQLQAALPPDQYAKFTLVILVVNILLRIKTTKDLADK